MKANSKSWALECIDYLQNLDICRCSSPSLEKIKQNTIIKKLLNADYIDTILFKFQSEIEKKNVSQ